MSCEMGDACCANQIQIFKTDFTKVIYGHHTTIMEKSYKHQSATSDTYFDNTNSEFKSF